MWVRSLDWDDFPGVGSSQVVLVVKNPPANAGDSGLIPESGRSPGEGNGNPLQFSCLWKVPCSGEAWWATVCGVAKRETRLSTCTHRRENPACVEAAASWPRD